MNSLQWLSEPNDFLHLLLTNRFLSACLSTAHFCEDELVDWSLEAKWARLLITTNGCLLLLRSKLEGVWAGRNNDKKWIDAFARACLCKRFLPLALWYWIKQRLRKIWSGSCVTFRWLEEEEGYPVVGQGKLHRMGKLMLVENTLRTNSCVKIVFASIQLLNSQPHATRTGYYCAKWRVLCRIWPTTWSGWSSPTWRWPSWRLTISSKSGKTFSRPFGRTRSDRRAQPLTQTSWQNPCR